MSKKNKKNKSKLTAQANNVQAESELKQTVVPTNENLQNNSQTTEAKTDNSQLENSQNNSQLVETEVQGEKGKNKVVEVKAKDVDKKKKKEKVKKPNKVAKALKDTGSELKKVTWPKFGQVVKQTGIVLAVVIIFALVLLGLDKLCSLLVGLLN